MSVEYKASVLVVQIWYAEKKVEMWVKIKADITEVGVCIQFISFSTGVHFYMEF